ncbi:hypothetical protein ACLOJK_014317 [Asimina triloba]
MQNAKPSAVKVVLFLLGLAKYGKGDWRSISRNFVVSRTPTQVASHAQKYFIRLNSMNKDRRRSSIHDITSVGNGDTSVPQGPITGLPNSPSGTSSKSAKQSSQPPPGTSGVGVYGTTTIGQPVGGPLVSAVGTPVNLSAPPHLAYGVRAPVPGAMVPSAPVNMPPVTYPVPHASTPNSVQKENGLLAISGSVFISLDTIRQLRGGSGNGYCISTVAFILTH